jgi:hypothetical protein
MRHQDIEHRSLIELNNNSIQCYFIVTSVMQGLWQDLCLVMVRSDRLSWEMP